MSFGDVLIVGSFNDSIDYRNGSKVNDLVHN